MESDFEQALAEAHNPEAKAKRQREVIKEYKKNIGMIDNEIHHTYLIKVSFYVKTATGFQKSCCLFTSNHSATSKKFDDFARRRVKLVHNFSHFADDMYSEHAVALQDFCE